MEDVQYQSHKPRSRHLVQRAIQYKYETKAHVFDTLPEEYKPVQVFCNVSITKISYKDIKKEIHFFWKTEIGGKHTPENKNKKNY